MQLHFADLRIITHGADSYAQGLDPMVKNPADPWQRRLNYPRIWQGLYSLGINKSHTTALGIAEICCFLIGVCLILPNARKAMLVAVFAAVLSPATLLGVERANTDLLLFFLAALSIIAAQRSYMITSVIVLDGFLLKLYPIFGLTVLLKAEKSKFLRYTLALVVFGAAYAAATFSDLLLINEATPKATLLGYGMNVCWMKLAAVNATLGWYAKIFSYIAVPCIIAATFSRSLSSNPPTPSEGAEIYLDSFRVGSGIYIGTFLLGNNWDYRLMFLILALPQLVLWAKISIASKITISTIFISLWYTFLARLFNYLPWGGYFSFGLDELCNWSVFCGLLYLFFWSLPQWLKEMPQKVSRR